jgi:hypothetical protein
VVGDEPPAFMRLAFDIGLAGSALGVERVEGEVEIFADEREFLTAARRNWRVG